ncbi:hypothetical protein GY45DRAFT_1242165 [Cubamyces sp. BRFM 1775]|nr:hypothetical protein GY45DRAFT_1242165 [Cubamyces sp. BRFM 1775]
MTRAFPPRALVNGCADARLPPICDGISRQRPRSVLTQPGQPVTFATGVFARRTIRAEIEEIQKADLGRKYARKDKRPLDPPPVVLCRFFYLVDRPSGPPLEIEIDPEQILGAICHVDLFPVPDDIDPNASPAPSAHHGRPHQGPSQPPVLPGVHNMMSDYAYSSAARYAAESALGVQGDEVVAWFGAFPIYENSKCTAMLSGATFMQSAVIDYRGKKTAMFVFSDLAVKIEGTFVLRYRAFTLFSECAQEPRMPVLAECYGGPFKIYSTKEFPGLLASTELTKRLALHGVRVNLRETPRRRRKKHEIDEDANMSDHEHEHGGHDPGAGHDSFVYSGSETATTTSPTVPFGPGPGSGPSSRSPMSPGFPTPSSMATSAYSPTDSAGGASPAFASGPSTVYMGTRSGTSSRAGMGAMGMGSRGASAAAQAAMGHAAAGAAGMGRARGASPPGRYYARSESSMDE